MKRFVAIILACLLLGSVLTGAWAEGDAVEIIPEDLPSVELDLLPPEDAGDLDAPLDSEVLILPEAEELSEAIVTNSSSSDAETLTISKSVTKRVTVGHTYQIKVADKTIKTCKSNNKKVATVSKSGLVNTLKTGTAKITITPTKGSKLVLKLKVYGKKVPVSVAIDQGKEAEMTVGETLQLSATVAPSTASQKVTWKSSKTSVATVSSKGVVKAKKAGTATISATTSNDRTAKLKVTVTRSYDGHYVISHAMGGVDGNEYSNSLEAFLENYAEGHRIFEVDFQYTSDDKLVLWHNWKNRFSSKYKSGYVPTYKQFMKSKIYGEYTPLDVERLLKLMADYPDVRIVTDTKYADAGIAKKQFKFIVSTAKEMGLKRVLDRFVVEVYTTDMFKAVKKIYPFKEYMMTLYRAFKKAPSNSKMKSLAKYGKEHGISTIVMDAKWWKSSYASILDAYGIESALFTVNDWDDAEDFFDDGVTALFTDYLPPM